MQGLLLWFFLPVIGLTVGQCATAPCGTLFGHGFINSYGQLRHGRTDWLWNIHSASNTRIKVKIHWAYMDNCDTDYFMLLTQNGQAGEVWCGNGSGTLEVYTNRAMFQYVAVGKPKTDWKVEYMSVVDGEWSPWSGWLPCSHSCGGGSQYRARFCSEPVNGGRGCVGPDKSQRKCNTHDCPAIVTPWVGWSDWQPCNRTCGRGMQTRCRKCPRFSTCQGAKCEDRDCYIRPCPLDGQWTPWEALPCSATCGAGIKESRRYCDMPKPLYGGLYCVGSSRMSEACNLKPCPNMHWSSWGIWGDCDRSCGGGYQNRTRECFNEYPDLYDTSCGSTNWQTRRCATKPCPIDGVVSKWSDWMCCDATCGQSRQIRTRGCSSPSPMHGGALCQDMLWEDRECENKPCPIDGNWSHWSEWSHCSVTCGNGYRNRSRHCDTPEPTHGGAECHGAPWEVQACAVDTCVVDGGWSRWSPWLRCTASCEGGLQKRERTCTEPAPDNGGDDCGAEDTQLQECNTHQCPVVDGSWASWSNWNQCDVTCGTGNHYRSRVCSDPQPVGGGADCSGNSWEYQTCHNADC